MSKHAHLFIAHNNFKVLDYAFKMLDDPRNVIFLLVDKKTGRDEYSFLLQGKLKFSPVIELEQRYINWAGYSSIEATVALIDAAFNFNEQFSFYHLHQGADLPIKRQDEIHTFFENNRCLDFIDFEPANYKFAEYKTFYYHFIVDSRFYRTNRVLKALNHASARLQRLLGLKRAKSARQYHGSALFSISDELARYIVKQKDLVHNEYRYTLGGDEVFLQTLVMQSEFRNKIAEFEKPLFGNARLIEKRNPDRKNSPDTYTTADYEHLVNMPEGLCFARKFDENKDLDIVKKLHDVLT